MVVMYPRKKIATAIEFVRLTYNRICTRWRKYVDDSFRNVPYFLGFTSNILFYFTVIIVTEVNIIHHTEDACDNIKRYSVIRVDHDVNTRKN